MTTRKQTEMLARLLVAACQKLRAENPQKTAHDAARLQQDTYALQQAESALGYAGPVYGNTYDSAGDLVWVPAAERTPAGIFGTGSCFGVNLTDA